jgi:hypothetical protein
MYVIMRIEVITISDMGNEAMTPAILAKTARMGLVPKHRMAMENPRKNAATPTLSADQRRNTSRYNARIIGRRMSIVPSNGLAATNSVKAKTMVISSNWSND